MRLYHYCCSHSFEHIKLAGFLRPWKQIQLDGTPLIWLTDLDVPDRSALGLWSETIPCDRTEHCVAVETDLAVHWPRYARRFPRELRARVEMSTGALPMHWYVSEQRIPVVEILDQPGMKPGMKSQGGRR